MSKYKFSSGVILLLCNLQLGIGIVKEHGLYGPAQIGVLLCWAGSLIAGAVLIAQHK